VARSDVQRLAADNKRLERQRAELLLAFKKALRLVGVLGVNGCKCCRFDQPTYLLLQG
jgi:hypothetical protein